MRDRAVDHALEEFRRRRLQRFGLPVKTCPRPRDGMGRSRDARLAYDAALKPIPQSKAAINGVRVTTAVLNKTRNQAMEPGIAATEARNIPNGSPAQTAATVSPRTDAGVRQVRQPPRQQQSIHDPEALYRCMFNRLNVTLSHPMAEQVWIRAQHIIPPPLGAEVGAEFTNLANA